MYGNYVGTGNYLCFKINTGTYLTGILPNMDFGTEIGTAGVNNAGSGGYSYP